MIRNWHFAATCGLVCVMATTAQAGGWRFQWQAGQTLTYKVDQTTEVTEIVEGKTTHTGSKQSNTKRWQVLEIDPNGIATLQLTLTALRVATTTPSGEVLAFDSAEPEKSDPQMKEQLGKYVGQPLATLRVNVRGEVVEVKESKFSAASRYETDPPFVVHFPEEPTKSTWERSYKITLEPPHGTGEKVEAVQKYVCRKVEGNDATLAVTTALKAPPETLTDQIPLIPMQPSGDVVFDFQTGVLKSANLHIEKDLSGHLGEGSSYKFSSTYKEELQP